MIVVGLLFKIAPPLTFPEYLLIKVILIKVTFKLLVVVNILDNPCASRITLSLVFPWIVMFLLIVIFVLLLPVYILSSNMIISSEVALVNVPFIPVVIVLLILCVAANPLCKLIAANNIIVFYNL